MVNTSWKSIKDNDAIQFWGEYKTFASHGMNGLGGKIGFSIYVENMQTKNSLW